MTQNDTGQRDERYVISHSLYLKVFTILRHCSLCPLPSSTALCSRSHPQKLLRLHLHLIQHHKAYSSTCCERQKWLGRSERPPAAAANFTAILWHSL